MASPSGSAGFPPAAAAGSPQTGAPQQLAPPIVPEVAPDQKAFPVTGVASPARHAFAFLDPITRPVSNILNSLAESRAKLDLPNPGSTEHLTQHVKSVLAPNFVTDGGRADLTKVVSVNPVFQVTHGLASGQAEAPPSYNFGAVFGSDDLFLQSGYDGSGGVMMRANRRLFPGHILKAQGQFSSSEGRSIFQLEHDFQGRDNSINLKAVNPDPATASGIYQGSFLQSITRNFAAGVEGTYMRSPVNLPDVSMGGMLKWTSDAKDVIATLHVPQPGLFNATYFQKLAERVDVAVDLNIIAAGGRREAQAVAGAKWDFRGSTLRAALDSTGKLSVNHETRMGSSLAFTVSSEMDYPKGGAAKFGIGINMESAPEGLVDPMAPPPKGPNIPI